jgi:hypothetical protein
VAFDFNNTEPVLSFPALCKTLSQNLRHYEGWLISHDQDEGRFSDELALVQQMIEQVEGWEFDDPPGQDQTGRLRRGHRVFDGDRSDGR